MFRCTWWLYSGQVFQLCNAKYETVLNTDIYCGLEIKNRGSGSGIDFRYLEQRKKQCSLRHLGIENGRWTGGAMEDLRQTCSFLNSSVKARQATLGI